MATSGNRLAIFGSCVSRDALAFAGETCGYSLAAYFARCSLASLTAPAAVDEGVLRRIESPFQRRVVKADMDKSFIRFLKKAEFDILLLDLIDERFNLQELDGGALVTLSNEYLEAAASPLPGRTIRTGSSEHVMLWKQGLHLLLAIMPRTGGVERLRVNEVYWATRTSSGGAIAGFELGKINAVNKFLRERYADLRALLPAECFISYGDDVLVADERHKWGLSPFHYVGGLYQQTIAALPALTEAAPAAGPSTDAPGGLMAQRLRALAIADTAAQGRAILETRTWAPPNFAAAPFDASLFDQPEAAQGRTYLWWVHQMAFIPSLLGRDLVDGGTAGADLALAMTAAWTDRFAERVDFTLPAWHDHATALRARNLLLLRAHLRATATDLGSPQLDRLLVLHGQTLARDDFYNEGNNHGLDQNIVLFEVAAEMPGEDSAPQWRQVATKRMAKEVSHAFADDGGHVENSPGYQNYGIQQLVMIYNVLRSYGVNPDECLPPGVLAKSLRALTHLTKPNGKLPLIGDTYEFTVSDFVRDLRPEGYEEFLYAIRRGRQGRTPRDLDLVLRRSGWAVLRDAWRSGADFVQALHLAMKAGFISPFHRHDDDLQIELHAFAQDWIIDAGLYKHLNTDPHRIFVRSADAHSIPMPIGVRASRDVALIGSFSSITDYEGSADRATVTGQSGMFPGFLTRRTVTLDRASGAIRLLDRCEPVASSAQEKVAARVASGYPTFLSRFVVPADKRVSVDRAAGRVTIVGRGRSLVIACQQPVANIKMQAGVKEPRLAGWASTHRGQIAPAHAVEFQFAQASLEATFELTWLS